MTNKEPVKTNASQIQDIYTMMVFIWKIELNELYYNLFMW